MANIQKNVLIALLPNRHDFKIALKQNWFRIPFNSKLSPQSVKNKKLKLIAFYLPKTFGDDAFRVKYYGIVNDIKIVKRTTLFKNEPINEKSDKKYYKIIFDKLLQLPKPIYSRKKMKITLY